MIRGSDRGGGPERPDKLPNGKVPVMLPGPCHVFWFGGVCFTTACWSDEPRTVEYVGPDEDAARKVAADIDNKQQEMVESCLRDVLKRIDGGRL